MSGSKQVRTGGTVLTAFVAMAVVAGCGGGENGSGAGAPPASPAPAAGGLTAFQLEHGIGPITEVVTLPASVDAGQAAQGKAVFDQKCAACHKLEEKYIGPALGNVLERRTPAFVMNMILNPQEMIEQHPIVKQLLAETMSFMPNQGVTREEARAIVEYIRSANH